jgi:hypothetical protein
MLTGCATPDLAGGADVQPRTLYPMSDSTTPPASPPESSASARSLVFSGDLANAQPTGYYWYDHRNDWRDGVPAAYGNVYETSYSETITRDRQGGYGHWPHGRHGDSFTQTTHRTTIRQSAP